mgnify:CR=1 FL=1
MTNLNKFLKSSLVFSGILLSLSVMSGCAAVSEDQCASGNWLERGYKDGVDGESSSRISKYADTCSEYGFSVNTTDYLRGHRDGVELYCTYENGFALGENGSEFNQVCAGGIGDGFAEGYDAGRERYEIYQERESLIASYNDKREKLYGIRSRYDETDLMAGDIKRLRKKEARTETELEDIRIDIRAFERLYDLPRHSF